MALYIIADLHLSSSSADLCTAFENFVARLNHNDSLIISGDLFEFFVGEDPGSLAQQCVKNVARAARMRGIKCGFQQGNRDFLINKKEAEKLNLTLLPNCYVVPSPQGSCLILHGDDLCTNDIEYLKFKKMVSKPWLQWLFLHLPLSWRKKLALKMRQKSLNTKRNDERIFGVVRKTLQSYAELFKVDVVIHGHIHIFSRHFNELPRLKGRLVLGDWGSTFSYVRIDRNGIAMVQKPLEELLKGEKKAREEAFFRVPSRRGAPR